MKRKSVALAIVIVALFGSVAFAAVPHYWGSSSSDKQTTTEKKNSDSHDQNGGPARSEYGHGRDRGND